MHNERFKTSTYVFNKNIELNYVISVTSVTTNFILSAKCMVAIIILPHILNLIKLLIYSYLI